MFRGSLRSGNLHRPAGVGCAAGARDGGLDIERVETSGVFQCVEALVAHLRQKRAVGIEQPVEPVNQHADRQQIEQRLVAPGFAPRRLLGRRQPFGWFARRFGCFGRRRLLVDGCGRDRHRDGSTVFVVEPRRQLPGEFVEGAVFHLSQGGGLRIVHRPKRKDVLGRIHGGFQIGLL